MYYSSILIKRVIYRTMYISKLELIKILFILYILRLLSMRVDNKGYCASILIIITI